MSLPSAEFLPIDTISKHLARAVRYEPDASSRYELSPGLQELRVRVAQRAMDCGCSFGPDDIVITSGATEALALAMRAVTEPGDTIAVESPCILLLSDVVRTNFPDSTRATNPSGGHLLWVELPENVNAAALHESLAANKINLLPGSMFSAGGHYRNCLRLNAAVFWNARVENAIASIGRLAEEALR